MNPTPEMALAMKWTGTNGYYESDRGHVINSIGRRWFITWPGERTPDVEKSNLREAKAYADQFPGDRIELAVDQPL